MNLNLTATSAHSQIQGQFHWIAASPFPGKDASRMNLQGL